MTCFAAGVITSAPSMGSTASPATPRCGTSWILSIPRTAHWQASPLQALRRPLCDSGPGGLPIRRLRPGRAVSAVSERHIEQPGEGRGVVPARADATSAIDRPRRSSIGPGSVGSSCCRCFTANAARSSGGLEPGSRLSFLRFPVRRLRPPEHRYGSGTRAAAAVQGSRARGFVEGH